MNAAQTYAVMLSSERIAYVDVQKVFDEYKGTKEATRKLSEAMRIKREELILAENEIREMEKRIEMVQQETGQEALTGLVAGGEITESTGAVKLSPLEVLGRKKEKIENMVRDTEETLLLKEDEIRQQILGQIYDVIREIAEEEGYSIVLSRDDVLYVEKSSVDLTDRVIKKLNK